LKTRRPFGAVALRTVAYAFAASAVVFVVVVVLSFMTTDGHGCENGCSAYERTLIRAGPIVFWLSVLLGIGALGAWFARRRFANRSVKLL
jgi:cytochrome bd-type quinol oxidase subunit 2